MVDFLLFRSFLSPSVLMVFYYLGALGVPVALVAAALWVRRRLPSLDPAVLAALRPPPALVRYRRHLVAASLVAFLLGELGWRMMFEFLIAYFRMHDLLQVMAGA